MARYRPRFLCSLFRTLLLRIIESTRRSVRVGEDDRTLARPVESRGQAADHRAEQDGPLGAVPVVLVFLFASVKLTTVSQCENSQSAALYGAHPSVPRIRVRLTPILLTIIGASVQRSPMRPKTIELAPLGRLYQDWRRSEQRTEVLDEVRKQSTSCS